MKNAWWIAKAITYAEERIIATLRVVVAAGLAEKCDRCGWHLRTLQRNVTNAAGFITKQISGRRVWRWCSSMDRNTACVACVVTNIMVNAASLITWVLPQITQLCKLRDVGYRMSLTMLRIDVESGILVVIGKNDDMKYENCTRMCTKGLECAPKYQLALMPRLEIYIERELMNFFIFYVVSNEQYMRALLDVYFKVIKSSTFNQDMHNMENLVHICTIIINMKNIINISNILNDK